MSATADPADSAEELLPFWVNGRLEGAERSLVEAALDTDPDLAREAAALAAIRTGMQAQVPAVSPGELGLARLHRALDRRSGNGRIWGFAAMAALAAASVTWLFLATGLIGGDRASGGFQLASAAGGASVLTVAFRPGASLDEVTALLQEIGLTIVDGPSALGFYRLAPPEGAAPGDIVSGLTRPGSPVEVIEPGQ